MSIFFFFFHYPATTEIYTLSLHDAFRSQHVDEARRHRLAVRIDPFTRRAARVNGSMRTARRSEEHTSELQSPDHLVCRLLLEKKNKRKNETTYTTKRRNM